MSSKIIVKRLKKRFDVTLCCDCADRFIVDWTGLVGCACSWMYNGGDYVESYVEPQTCELCGRQGYWFTYILPKWRAGKR
ncbi:MAG: hypothetical protein QXK89_01510 [Candidatus Bathyarchaeia archaeon]